MKKVFLIGLSILGLLSSCSKDNKTDDVIVKKELKASELLAPVDKSTILENTISLEWKKNEDLKAKYDLYLGKKAELVATDKIASDLSDIKYKASDLEDNTTYFWRVDTKNEDSKIVSSAVFSFSVKLPITNALPTKPVLTFPKNESSLMKTELNLLWDASTDEDGDDIVYDIYYSETDKFTDDDKEPDFKGTKITLKDLKANTKFFWQVVAKDGKGGETKSDVFTFTTHKVPNSALLLPVDDYKGDKPEKLTWEVEEGFKYTVVLDKSNAFSAASVIAKNLTVGECPVTDIEANVLYYWQIVAINAAGTQFSSEVRTFTYAKTIEGPVFGSFTDRDNKVYKTVIINGVEWLAENYAFIPEDNANRIWMIPGRNPKDAAYENVKEDENYKKYGLIYNFEAILEVIPEGWHIATDDEWNDIEEFFGMKNSDREMSNYRGSHASAFMKDGEWGKEASNISGMGLLPAGMGKLDYSTSPMGNKTLDFQAKAWVWTGTAKGLKYYYRSIFNDDSKEEYAGIKRGIENKTTRMAIRLVKNK